MSNDSNAVLSDKINNEIEKMFDGVSTMTKEKLKQTVDVCLKSCSTHQDANRSGTSITDELKKKMCQVLTTELDKINTNTISKDQAKNICACLCHLSGKDSNFSSREQHFQSALKEQFDKLNAQQINATQAKEILKNIRSPHSTNRHGTMIDDRVKDEFFNDFKTKFGTNKISADDAWDLIKSFDKKHHETFEKDKENKWDEMFNEQVEQLFGDVTKVNLNQQQVEDLAKKVREKIRADCPQHPGKRFCQH